jgi:hypothetical protein
MPYRETGSEDLDLDARELQAAATLGQRRSAFETRVLLAAILSGVVAGVFGYFAMSEWQLRLFPMAFGRVSIVGFVAPLLASAWLGSRLAGRLLRRRTPAWVDEVARAHAVPRERLLGLVRAGEALR